jgi:predicted membrane-bound mannosyltransferase
MTPFVQTLFFLINLALMVFLATVAGFSIVSADAVHNLSMLFLSVYLLLFAIFVFLHDMSIVCKMDSVYKNNFPFLDQALGKGLFLIL